MQVRWLSPVLALLLVLLGATPALADGIIILRPRPPVPPPPLRSLAIKYHRVTVTIEDQVARTHVDQVFLNESGQELEGEYIFPVPEGASISSFALWVDGQRLEAQILDRDKARQIYEEIVRQRRDPALLEYVGRNAFRARIYPIPAYGEKRVELEYTEILPRDGGLVRYVYPLNTEKFSSKPLQEVQVSVRLATKRPLQAIYSPSHEVDVLREGDRQAMVGYEAKNVTPNKDFVLYYGMGEQELQSSLLSYREGDEAGFFLLLLTPPRQAAPEEVVPKDVFFVLDTSGSMRGEKLTQAKEAAKFVLHQLNPEDRFNIIAFATATQHFASGPRPAQEANQAKGFLAALEARGGTNIHRALQETLAQCDPARPQVILFLTDGLPTEGETEVNKILQDVAKAAPENVRLFAFGVGDDVNTLLLDSLTQKHHGTTVYVRPGENIERAVSSFYEKISNPVLTGISLDFSGVQVEDLYPYPLPDLFAGGQLVVVGRYRQGGEATLTLRGTKDDQPASYRYEAVRFTTDGGPDFIPRLWATRKIGHLLTQIRLHGAEHELVDEVIALSVRYGIVTPYTSFLVDETEDALTPEGREELAQRALAPRGGIGSAAPAALASGAQAVEKSIAQDALRRAEVPAEPQTEQVRTIGDKTFVLRQGSWTDTDWEAQKIKAEEILWGSERYFALVRQYPALGRYLAVGSDVIIVWQGRAYAIQSATHAGQTNADTASPKPTPTPQTAEDDFWRQIQTWWRNLWR